MEVLSLPACTVRYNPLLPPPSIALDLPGHGKSAELGPFTIKASTEYLRTLVQFLKNDATYCDYELVLVGISLGGQAVLDYLINYPSTISGAGVSGASIHPPGVTATWEMPHMPTDQEWLDTFTRDIEIMGMGNAAALQEQSFNFAFEPVTNEKSKYPPVLVCVGEHDVAMAKRDFKSW